MCIAVAEWLSKNYMGSSSGQKASTSSMATLEGDKCGLRRGDRRFGRGSSYSSSTALSSSLSSWLSMSTSTGRRAGERGVPEDDDLRSRGECGLEVRFRRFGLALCSRSSNSCRSRSSSSAVARSGLCARQWNDCQSACHNDRHASS
jgi:hypothetical protein